MISSVLRFSMRSLLCLIFIPQFATLQADNTVTEYYPIIVEKSQTYTHNSRRLNGVSLIGSQDGDQTISLSSNFVYNITETPAFTARAGEMITPTFNFSGNWMHGYVYLDRGQDGAFDGVLNNEGTVSEGSDIMAFSYAESVLGSGVGYNSTGAKVVNNNVLNPPSFKIPSDLANGFYRMRFKVDWASIDPAGRAEDGNGIIKNGGAIFDVRINIHGDNCKVDATAQHGSLLTAVGESFEAYSHPFGTELVVKAVPEVGYVCDAIRIRHGYNLEGDASIFGVAQYDDVVIPAYLFKDNCYTIPADMLDGDIRIEGVFVEVSSSISDGRNYALSFEKEAPMTNVANKITSVDFHVNSMKSTAFALNEVDATIYRNISSAELAVRRGTAVNTTVNADEGLHHYLYIDLNNDGEFMPVLDKNGLLAMSSELLSFTYYNGKDSRAQIVNEDEAGLQMPMFEISSLLPSGIYRARLKSDINNIDPAGSSSIVENGGMIVDFLLNVGKEQSDLLLDSYHCAIYDNSNSALPIAIPSFSALSVNVVPVDNGYILNEIRVKHGHNLDGPQYVHGNRQWGEYVLEQPKFTIPADSVNGDVEIYASYTAGPDAEYHLVFSDEFNAADGSQPADEWWSRCKRQGSTWNRWLSNSNDVVYIENGNLVTRAIPNPDTATDNVPMITGGIWSRNKFGFTYGRVEGRIFSNPWTGNFPAFWMMPEDQSGGWPNDGEIDIWETIDAQERSWHTVHSNWTYNLKNTSNPTSSFNVATPLDRYHIYAIEWNENSIVWFVDGKEVGRYAKSTNQNTLNQGQWPFDDHFHLILNQSVGNGSWAANADVTHTYETLFDWVRVYQKSGMENTLGTVGIKFVNDISPLNVEVVDGRVVLSSSRLTNVSLYDVSGRKIHEAPLNGVCEIALEQGIYIINGNKICVR